MRHPSPQLAPGGSDQVDIKHKTVVQISMHCILFSLSLSLSLSLGSVWLQRSRFRWDTLRKDDVAFSWMALIL